MNRASAYLKSLIGPNEPFKTQCELAEKTCRTPSTINAALKSQQIGPKLLKAILGALQPSQQRELLKYAVMDAIPQEYWEMVISGDQAFLQNARFPQLGRSVEALFNVIRLKASTEKKVHQMFETAAVMLRIP